MGPFYILTAIFIWSSLGVIVRLSGVPVHVLIFYSSVISAAVQGAILLRKDYRPLLDFKKKGLFLLILGPVSLLNIGTFFYAYKHTTITNAVMTHYIAPLVVAFLAPLFLREFISRRVIFSIVIASAGLWILLGVAPESLIRPSEDTAGILAGLFSGFVYGVLIIMIRIYALNFNPVVISFSQNFTISLILLPFIRTFPLNALWAFALMGVVHSVIAPILYYMGMREVTANRTAVLGYIEPLGAIMFSMIFLGEYPPPVSLIGGALILFSGYLTLKKGD